MVQECHLRQPPRKVGDLGNKVLHGGLEAEPANLDPRLYGCFHLQSEMSERAANSHNFTISTADVGGA